MYDRWLSKLKRKTVITGHYGSGKTEFSVSLAMLLAARLANRAHTGTSGDFRSVALIDLDIVNPYFRSRRRRELLENEDISVFGSLYDKEITAELPALGASIRTPLEDNTSRVIIDLGGNDSGASVINQFRKYFTSSDTILAAVINANRPDTSTAEGVLGQITAIEMITGLTISHLINNTHMLRETTLQDIENGHKLCMQVCAETGKDLLCDCYPDGLIEPLELTVLTKNLMPLGLFMRPKWLDTK